MTDFYLLQENGDLILQESGDYLIIDPALSATGHRVRLLYGSKQNPAYVFDLAQSDNQGNVFLLTSGFAPNPGETNISYRDSFGLDGQARYHSRIDNIRLRLGYFLQGGSAADLENLQAGINRFLEETRLHHEHRQGGQCWLEYCWADGLQGPLLFGQRERYYEIIRAVPTYPDDLHGIGLVNNQIEKILLDLECAPLIEGIEQIAGDCSGLPDQESDIDLTYQLDTHIDGVSFSVSGWIEHITATYVFFEYYVSSLEYLRVWYDSSGGTIKISKTSGGVTTTTTSSAVSLAGPTQLIFTNQRYGSAIAYINGSAVATTGYIPTGGGGQLRLGGSVQDTSQTSYTNTLDGWKIWGRELSSSEASQLYVNERVIKMRGEWIGRPLYHKTIDGAGTYHAVNGALSSVAKDNWGVIGRVPGDAPARVRWAIDPPTSSPSRVYWLGNKIFDSAFTPTGVLWIDYNTTSDSGNSSGDGYTSSGAGTGDVGFTGKIDPPRSAARGRFRVLARMKVSTNSVSVTPVFKLGSSDNVEMDAISVATNASFLLRDLGDLFINWPYKSPPSALYAGFVVSRASTATVDVDFIMLLPWPSCRVEAEQASLTIGSGDTLIIEGREAYVLDASDNESQLQRMTFEGDEVWVWPRKYNHIILIQGEEGTAYTVTRAATVRAYVTPRWRMGGGPAG